MPRVKNGVAHHARKKKIMQAAKGARGGRSKLYKAAKETAERAMREHLTYVCDLVEAVRRTNPGEGAIDALGQ